jgi:hypothetical protein
MVAKSLSNETENRMTMAMCRKLLVISIVANSFLGNDNIFLMISNLAGWVSSMLSKSFCVREKRATSVAAISEQQKSRIMMPHIPKNIAESI